MVEPEVIKQQIDCHVRYLLASRALCPHIKKEMIGQACCPTAPFYAHHGLAVTMVFATPLTAARIDQLNDVGHWINQGFVLRLYALLEYHHIIGEKIGINHQLDGHDEIDILRRLRRLFAHTSGEYDSHDAEKRKLYKRIAKHFSLDVADHPEAEGKFPIPIDAVLIPLAAGCKRYVDALAEQRG